MSPKVLEGGSGETFSKRFPPACFKTSFSRWLPFLFFLLLAVVFGSPALRDPGNWGIGDWDQFLFYAEAGRKSIVGYGQFPLWAPYFCGGNVLFANPQSQFLSPSFLLILAFGSLLGMKLKIFVAIFVGLTGMYLCARELKFSALASVFAAVVFQLSGTYFAYAANGQQWIQPFALIPFALLFFHRSGRSALWAPAAAMVLALMWFEGGIYPFPFAVLLLGMYAVLFAERGQALTLVVRFLLVLGLTFLLGAVKFMPFMETFSSSSRHLPLEAHDIVSARLLYQIFFESRPDVFGGHYHYFEYFGYVGWLPAALVLLSLLRLRASWRWWVVFAVGFFLVLGVGSPVPLWPLLHEAPFFGSMHVTSRFRILLAVPVAMLAAVSFDWLAALIGERRRWKAVVPAAILLLTIGNLLAVTRPQLARAFVNEPRPFEAGGGFVQHWELPRYGGSWGMYPAALAEVGTVTCYEYFTVPSIGLRGRLVKFGPAAAAGSPFYRGEVFLESGGGAARYLFWSPRRLAVETGAEGAGVLVVNQSYHGNWKVAVDGAAARAMPSKSHLLSVRLAPGRHRVEFRYVSRAFVKGGLISAAAWLVCLLFLVRGAWCGVRGREGSKVKG